MKNSKRASKLLNEELRVEGASSKHVFRPFSVPHSEFGTRSEHAVIRILTNAPAGFELCRISFKYCNDNTLRSDGTQGLCSRSAIGK